MKAKGKLRAMGAMLACAGLAFAGMLIGSPRGRADDEGNSDARVRIGYEIAPVPLSIKGKNPDLVGLGSYIVNTEGCNDCHSAGPPKEYVVPTGNPYFGKPKQVNPKYYLGGGRDFGELASPPIGSAHIISRNLTPTPSTGLPGGDITYEKFLQIIRHGTDLDTTIHPTCTGAPNVGCIPPPFDGSLLQIMPWPNFKDLTDHETRAIYEYLKAIPCLQGNYPGPGGAFANIPAEPADRCTP